MTGYAIIPLTQDEGVDGLLKQMAKRGITYDTPEATEFAVQLANNKGDVYQTALDTRKLAKMYRSDGEHELADTYDRLANSVMHQHIEKGYVYFAMGFSIFVEMLNMRLRKHSNPVKLHNRITAENQE